MISSDDILITAPYNLQVNRLRRRLGSGFQVGSVDRFQGQEAVVAISRSIDEVHQLSRICRLREL